MSSLGFVYILTNPYMPDVYKVGCTERSPHLRAEELSKPTGVPSPFKVLCFAEFADFQGVERSMHKWLDTNRISGEREFFHHGIGFAIRLLYWHPARISFASTEKPGFVCSALAAMNEAAPDCEFDCLSETADPFGVPPKPEIEAAPAETLDAEVPF